MRNIEQETEALARLFEGRNRAAFARDTKFPGGQAMTYQNITGRKPISLDGAIAYARGFGCPIASVSRHWAQVLSALPLFASETPNQYGDNVAPIGTRHPQLSPLQAHLLEISSGLNETGLAILIGRAQEIALQYPVRPAKNLQN